jgi:hypothetical protein
VLSLCVFFFLSFFLSFFSSPSRVLCLSLKRLSSVLPLSPFRWWCSISLFFLSLLLMFAASIPAPAHYLISLFPFHALRTLDTHPKHTQVSPPVSLPIPAACVRPAPRVPDCLVTRPSILHPPPPPSPLVLLPSTCRSSLLSSSSFALVAQRPAPAGGVPRRCHHLQQLREELPRQALLVRQTSASSPPTASSAAAAASAVVSVMSTRGSGRPSATRPWR